MLQVQLLQLLLIKQQKEDEGRKTSPEEIKQGGFIVIVKDKQYGSAGHLIAR